jgi:medium-chain acyl-[acyl-carrier-protein] hydrolase
MSVASQATQWLVRPRPIAEPRLRLFCIPFAGGGPILFRPWADLLPDDIEVCALQLPGREMRFRERPFSRLEPLVLDTAEALASCLDRPFAIFGHSLGALIAFEWARELRRRSLPGPTRLFVAGRVAPQCQRRQHDLHDMPEATFRDELRTLGGTPPEILDHDEIMALFTPVLRADLAVNETYQYRDDAPLDCPITAIGGTDDPLVNRDEIGAWRSQTDSEFTLYQVPGNHFFIQSQQNAVLSIMRQTLADSEVRG